MAFAFSGTTLAALTITVSGTETSLTNLAALLNGVTTAARSTAYTTGTIKNAGNGNGYWYLCTTAGTTSATAPTWPTTEAGTVVDGGVTWTAFAQGYVLDTGLKKYCNISRFLFRFAASASLSYDAELWCIVGNMNVPATSAQVIVPSGSTLTIGALTAATSDAAFYRNVQTDGLILPKDNASSAGSPVLQVDAGGTLNLYGATITSRSVINLSGTFKVRNGVINRPTGGTAWRVNFGSTTIVDIIGLYAPSVRWCTQLGMTVTNLSGFKGFDNLQWDVNVLASTASSFFTIRDQPYNGFPAGVVNGIDAAHRNGFCWLFLNAEKGDGLNVYPYTSTSEGVTEVRQELTIKFRTSAGGSVDTPIWFARGYNNGRRKDYTSSPRPANTQYATQGDDTYVVSGNSSGDCAATAVLNFVCVSNATDSTATQSNVSPSYYDIRCDGGNRGSNVRTLYYKRYGSLPQTLKATMMGVGGTTISVIDAADTSVTLSRTSAGALSSMATLDDFYDAAIYWSTTPALANLEYPTSSTYLVSASGKQISLGSLNLVIDATASAAFAVNTGTNTITIKASTLALGSKFTSITTTGTVTFANGASVGTNVVVTSSSGSNGWITISGMGTGSRLLVLDQLSSQLYNGVPGTSQSIYVPPGVTGSYSGTVALYGKQDVTWTQVVTGGGLFTISVVQIPDTGITQANSATVAAYTHANSPDEKYDQAALFKTTATGITIPRLIAKNGTAIDQGSIPSVFDSAAASVFDYVGGAIVTKTTTYVAGTAYSREINGGATVANGAIIDCNYQVGSTYHNRCQISPVVAGSSVHVETVDGVTEYFLTTNSSTSHRFTAVISADTAVTVRVRRQGYIPLEFASVITTTSGLSVQPAQTVDALQTSESDPANVTIDYANKKIRATGTRAIFTLQELVDIIRRGECTASGIELPVFANISGKTDLGGGVATAITVELISPWQVSWAAGSVYQATVSGGNLVGGIAADPIEDVAGGPQVTVMLSQAATLVNTATPAQIADAVISLLMDGSPAEIESGITFRQSQRALLADAAGERLTSGSFNTIHAAGIGSGQPARISGSVDDAGNRTGISLSL